VAISKPPQPGLAAAAIPDVDGERGVILGCRGELFQAAPVLLDVAVGLADAPRSIEDKQRSQIGRESVTIRQRRGAILAVLTDARDVAPEEIETGYGLAGLVPKPVNRGQCGVLVEAKLVFPIRDGD
jgi:hypothetical protein